MWDGTLMELLTQLRDDPNIPYTTGRSLFTDDPIYIEDDPTFDTYVVAAVEAFKAGEFTTAEVAEAIDSVNTFCGSNGDAKDYLTDLLRYVARESGDEGLHVAAVRAHLRILVMAGYSFLQSIQEREDTDYRWCRRAARRARRVVETVNVTDIADLAGDIEHIEAVRLLRTESFDDGTVAADLEILTRAAENTPEVLGSANSPLPQRCVKTRWAGRPYRDARSGVRSFYCRIRRAEQVPNRYQADGVVQRSSATRGRDLGW